MSTTHISEAKAGASYWHRQFQFQQNLNDDLQARVRKLDVDLEEHHRVIDEVRALHHESKFMKTVSYCDLCTERWPCESMLILTRSDAANETKTEGGGS